MMSIEQARLEYLYAEREKIIKELGSKDYIEYPWTLETKKEMLTEQIHSILNKRKQRGEL